MSSTILLDPAKWDMLLDVNGNIAVAQDPYALAQDVASACRLVLGELYYDTKQGVPQWSILGKLPSIQFIKNAYVAAALTVPGVTAAVCFIQSISRKDRLVIGQVQVTDVNGKILTVGF